MVRNSKKIAPYCLFLQEYWSPLKLRNGRNDMYTLKCFDQALRVATTGRTALLPPRSSSNASEHVRPSRHIALTAILNYGQLLGVSKTSQSYCNIQLLVGAWETSSSTSTPIGTIISKPFYLWNFWIVHFSWFSYLPRLDWEFLYLQSISLDSLSRLSHLHQLFLELLYFLSDITVSVYLTV